VPSTRFGGATRWRGHPAQIVVAAFVAAAFAGGALLMLPFATEDGSSASPLTALFTATSAVCVTGLTVVDTGSYWSPFGEGVILLLIQAGGLGIMTLTAMIVMSLARRLGLRQRLIVAASTGTMQLGQVRAVLAGVARVTIVAEVVVASVLFLRFWAAHDQPVGRAAYNGLFHAVSAFNNAGFSLFRDSLADFDDDPVILLTISVAIIVGGLGYPVWLQVARRPREPRRWDLHTKLTVSTTLVLIPLSAALIIWLEWTNPATLGDMSTPRSLLNGFFHGVTPRTAGFQTLDMGAVEEPTRLVTEVLMFIGGGSGSTAGGIKVTTFALLGFVIWAEARGDPDVVVFRRRVPVGAHRQALSVALLAVGAVVASTILLLRLAHDLDPTAIRFETISALGTVGLSTGITPELSGASQAVMMGLMLLGRVGPPTLFAALALRESERLYRLPEERPIVG
jgi:trk system potassium uptake protein